MKFRGQRFLAALLASALLFTGSGFYASASELNPGEAAVVDEQQEAANDEEDSESIIIEGEEETISNDQENTEAEPEEPSDISEISENPGEEQDIEMPDQQQETEESVEDELLPMDHSVTDADILGAYGDYYIPSLDQNMASAGLYSDVPETPGWRYDAITYVTDHGIMNGLSGTGRFAPDEPMTRAMFATVVYRIAGSPSAYFNSKFPDVPFGNYYSVPISWASDKNIVRGHSNTGLFGTMENVTREDLVTMIYRYAQYKGIKTNDQKSLENYVDESQVSGYARVAMQWAVAKGIISGRSGTKRLDPKGDATRVECAAIIQRFMQITGAGNNNNSNNNNGNNNNSNNNNNNNNNGNNNNNSQVDPDKYTIMGASTVTVDQMVRYYKARASYPDFYSNTEASTIEKFCQIYYDECAAEGVRVEVAFCQAMKETGYLRYGGDVLIEQYNFAGMGATGNGARGIYFDSPRIGIRAQIQHLKAYACTDNLNRDCVDPRFKYVQRGCAPYVQWLGIRENPYGRGWATAQNYGYQIVDMISKLKAY